MRDRDQRGEMEDDVDALHHLLHELTVPNVARDDLHVESAWNRLEPAPIVERVVLCESAHTAACRHQPLDQMRADETVSPGDENACAGEIHFRSNQ